MSHYPANAIYKIQFARDEKGYINLYSPFFDKGEFSLKSLESRIKDYFRKTKEDSPEGIGDEQSYNSALDGMFETSNIKMISKDNYGYFLLEDRIKKQEMLVDSLCARYENRFMGLSELNIVCSVINNEIRKYNLRSRNYNHRIPGDNKEGNKESIPICDRERMPTRSNAESETGKQFMQRHLRMIYILAGLASEKMGYIRKAGALYNKLKSNIKKSIEAEFKISDSYKKAAGKRRINNMFNSFLNELLPSDASRLNKLIAEEGPYSDPSFLYRGMAVKNTLKSEFANEIRKKSLYYDDNEMNHICTDAFMQYQEGLYKLFPDSRKKSISFGTLHDNQEQQETVAV